MSDGGKKLEVAKDGVVRIPKSVFESTPSVGSSSSSTVEGGGKKTFVRRLDGTLEEVTTGLPPTNPNFAPRSAWPGGKIVTNDKLEVKLKFYERKGIPLTPELLQKKEELAAAAASSGTASKVGGGSKPKSKGAKAGGDAPAAPTAAPEVKAWYKNRPKGGVKTEGALTTGKRSADAPPAEQPTSKQPTLA